MLIKLNFFDVLLSPHFKAAAKEGVQVRDAVCSPLCTNTWPFVGGRAAWARCWCHLVPSFPSLTHCQTPPWSTTETASSFGSLLPILSSTLSLGVQTFEFLVTLRELQIHHLQPQGLCLDLSAPLALTLCIPFCFSCRECASRDGAEILLDQEQGQMLLCL